MYVSPKSSAYPILDGIDIHCSLCFFIFFSSKFKIFSLLFIVDVAAARPTIYNAVYAHERGIELNDGMSTPQSQPRRALFSFPILPKFYYAKRRFFVTSKYRQMHGVLNVDEIKN
jgi:hypothetical protein